MNLKKDPVYQYVNSLSGIEKKRLISFLKSRNYGEETVQLLRIYWEGEETNGGNNTLELAGNFSAQVKYSLKSAIKAFKQSKKYFGDERIEALVIEARAYYELVEYAKGLDVLCSAFEILIEEDRFEELTVVYDLAQAGLKKISRQDAAAMRYQAMRKKIDGLMEGHQVWIELMRLWDMYAVPYIEKRELNGEMDLLLVINLRAKLNKICLPIATTRTLAQYHYMMNFVSLGYGDYKPAQLHQSELISLFEHFPLLIQYYSNIYPNVIMQNVLAQTETKKKESAMQGLQKLKAGWEETQELEYLWRYLMAGLTIAEVFFDSTLNRHCELLYFAQFDSLKAGINDKYFIIITFYLLRNKIILNQNGQVNRLVHLLESFSRTQLKLEIQVYTRLIQIITAWEDGKFELMKSLVKNCKSFLRRNDQEAQFPFAMLVIDFFSQLRSNMTYDQLCIRVEQTRMLVDGTPPSGIPEKKYFNWQYYFKEKEAVLKGVHNQHTS